MKATKTWILMLTALCVTQAHAGETKLSELTGTFRSTKAGPYVELDGGGEMRLMMSKEFDKLFNRIPKGTRVWVRGKIVSRLYKRPPADRPVAVRVKTHWRIEMTVKEVEKITKPFEIPFKVPFKKPEPLMPLGDRDPAPPPIRSDPAPPPIRTERD